MASNIIILIFRQVMKINWGNQQILKTRHTFSCCHHATPQITACKVDKIITWNIIFSVFYDSSNNMPWSNSDCLGNVRKKSTDVFALHVARSGHLVSCGGGGGGGSAKNGISMKNGEWKNGRGLRRGTTPHPSPYISLAIFCAVPQLTERLEQATLHVDTSVTGLRFERRRVARVMDFVGTVYRTLRVAKGYFITALGIVGMATSERLGHCLHVFAIDTQISA